MHGLEFPGQCDDLGRVIPARSGKHGNSPRGFFQGDFHNSQMLVPSERRIFTGRAAGHQEIDSRIDLAAHQPAKRRFIERRIAPEWSD